MNGLLRGMALISLLLSGAIFGFFYAWVCSTMWGLDRLEPDTAIAAMQAMNASVRNGVFAPAFFGTPFVLLATALVGWRAREGLSASPREWGRTGAGSRPVGVDTLRQVLCWS